MKKNLKIFIFILIIVFLFINNHMIVNAEELEVESACIYYSINDKDKREDYSLVISNKIEAPTIHKSASAYDNTPIIDGSFLNNYCFKSDCKDGIVINSIRKYINEGNGCPNYLKIMNDPNTGYIAFAYESMPSNGNDEILENAPRETIKNEQTGLPDLSSGERQCSYIDGEKQVSFAVSDKDNKVIYINDNLSIYNNKTISNNIKYDELNNNKCFENIVVCKGVDESFNIYSDLPSACENEGIDKSNCNFNYMNNCKTFDYNKNSNLILVVNKCPGFSLYFDKYIESKTSDNLNLLKNYCKSVLKLYDISLKEYSCINMCINLNKYIDIKISNEYICGLSDRILAWIANILKWVKYIIPVIVIALGILDFIKAIASANDDEMKKAQKRFIIRLISAALIFIVPFIIEFVLEKMGFKIYDCGIIKL